MISHLQGNALLDLYGPLLSARQKEVLELYFQDDLSLAEIQENLEISKAAVYDALKKGVQIMERYDGVLHLIEKEERVRSFLAAHPEYENELGGLLE